METGTVIPSLELKNLSLSPTILTLHKTIANLGLRVLISPIINSTKLFNFGGC